MSLADLMKKIPGTRTGYQAIVNGTIICGCNECSHNYEKKEVPFLPATHRCNAVLDNHFNDMIIFDPQNIPEKCPFRVMKV
jgi:hypothetical protein